MIQWIRTSRLSIKNSLSEGSWGVAALASRASRARLQAQGMRVSRLRAWRDGTWGVAALATPQGVVACVFRAPPPPTCFTG